jgi:regulator of sirC expression with transglutaminase-like and TPR domain
MSTLTAFAQLIDTRDGRPLPLLEAVASLALDAYPASDPAEAVATVRKWGERLALRIAADMSPLNRLRLLNHFLFEELGFRGNVEAYDDADNSYLNRVVERRTGIPISLGLVYLEVGRAIGLRLAGVGFPSHFLVKLALSEGALLIDAFAGGAVLAEAELRRRLTAAFGGEPPRPLEAYLQPATEREILTRWLHNLKRIHLRTGDWPRLLKIADRLVILRPESCDELRDRAFAYEQLECPRAAAGDLSEYLARRPDAGDAAEVRARLAQLERSARRLN